MRHIALAIGLATLPMPANAAELLLFETDGCYWCDRWKDEVGDYYHKTREGQIAPLRIVDMDEGRPADLAFVGPVKASPTFVLVDQGQELGRIVGYPGERLFWVRMEAEMRKLGQ